MAAPGLHSLCLKSLCPFISPGLPVKKKKSANCRNCSAERWGPGGLQTSPCSLPACQSHPAGSGQSLVVLVLQNPLLVLQAQWCDQPPCHLQPQRLCSGATHEPFLHVSLLLLVSSLDSCYCPCQGGAGIQIFSSAPSALHSSETPGHDLLGRMSREVLLSHFPSKMPCR